MERSEVRRLFDLFPAQAKRSPKEDALAFKQGGRWLKHSTAEVIETADALSSALIGLGLRKGDRIGLISMNRPEWNFVDIATQQLGAVLVPIYPTATPEDYTYILGHSECRVVFVSTKAIHDKVQSIRAKLPALTEVYVFDEVAGAASWAALRDSGRAKPSAELAAMKAAVGPDDLASLIYTSGTTGTPKGVMLTHENILSNVRAVGDAIPMLGEVTKALSFLPLCHVFERTVNYIYQFGGLSIYYAESIETISENLKEVSPEVFVTVPRLLEKIYEKIVAKGTELGGVKRRLFDWALALGLAYEPDKASGAWRALQLGLARKLIFSKWQAALGGKVRVIVTGGSALQPRLARVFSAAGLTILEGYGLTETSPVIAVNRPDACRVGSVGPALPNVEIKIVDEPGYPAGEGEVLCRGPNVMKGYYHNAEATAEVMDSDGWFRTGDIGTLVEGRFLKITDRKKEMFKTSGGKYVAPLALEGRLKECALVENVMVVGENRKFPAALIVPNMDAVRKLCTERDIDSDAPDAFAPRGAVHALFSDEVARINRGFGQWEQVKQIRLVRDEWSTATGELTPKLSLKRRVLVVKYKELIDSIYA